MATTRRVLASIEQKSGYVVIRVYAEAGDDLELLASCAGQPELVAVLLAASRPEPRLAE